MIVNELLDLYTASQIRTILSIMGVETTRRQIRKARSGFRDPSTFTTLMPDPENSKDKIEIQWLSLKLTDQAHIELAKMGLHNEEEYAKATVRNALYSNNKVMAKLMAIEDEAFVWETICISLHRANRATIDDVKCRIEQTDIATKAVNDQRQRYLALQDQARQFKIWDHGGRNKDQNRARSEKIKKFLDARKPYLPPVDDESIIDLGSQPSAA